MSLTPPLVTVGIHPMTEKYHVSCRVCGTVQITGVGGFDDPKLAQALAQKHRGDHLEALEREMLEANA